MNIIKSGFFCFLLSCISYTVNASIIEVDYLTTGDKLLTRDTESNLEWLDLTHTINISYNDMLSELGVGGQFEGFRYANVNDIETLQSNAGLPTGLFSSTLSLHVDRTRSLMESVGITVPPSETTTFFTYGITSTAFEPTTSTSDRIIRGFRISYEVAAYGIQGVAGDDQGSSQVGHWLVRETAVVPVPGAIWLFGSGLIGLVGLARRKKAA